MLSRASFFINTVIAAGAYVLALLFVSPSFASEDCDTRFDLLAASPVGSWQLSREISVGRDGQRAGRISRTSMLGEELRDGVKHYWVEIASQPIRVEANGDNVADGDKFIVLSLVPEPILRCAKESLLNLSQHAVDSVVQMGDQAPARIAVDDGSSKTSSVRSNRSSQRITDLEAEPLQLNTKVFETLKLNIFRRINNDKAKVNARSDLVLWYSNAVPFGIIKTEGTSVINGEPKKSTREILEFSLTGATVQMTQ